MLLMLMALVTALVHMASSQDGGDNVLQQGKNEDIHSVIVTAKTRAFLSCESGDMVIKVNFTQPFKGLMYAHRSRNSPCRMHGTGGYYYELRIPLKGCGTWQESPRVFVNNITIRFHPALELEEDETKTVVCRYPPPLTPPPGGVIEPPTNIIPTTIPTRVGTAKLSEIEILIIICLLLFLSLLILGIGIAYFCLKRRNIHIIRKSNIAPSSAPPSQITRLSSSNLHPPSSLLSSVLGHTVRIPRAVPYSAPAARAASALSSPDHHYEDYPPSTSTETTSGEISETSASSSSLAEDQTDASKQLLYRKGFPKSILSIPKAILRKNGSKRWRTESSVHHHLSKPSPVRTNTSVKRAEMEDQTVTTMLEPENQIDEDSYSTVKDKFPRTPIVKKSSQQLESQPTATAPKTPMPVYAQVHKPKKSPMNKRAESAKTVDNFKGSARKPPVPGAVRRQRQILTVTPEERKTSEEVTKNTTVFTSVRREVAETRVLSPLLENSLKELNNAMTQSEIPTDSLEASSFELQMNGNKSETSTLISNVPKLDMKETKSVLIRDVADIYLTTTVETESRELTTTVSRDILQQHAKSNERQHELGSQSNKVKDNKIEEPNTSNVTNSWNVVIRQRDPPLQSANLGTTLDASSESNSESSEESQPKLQPQFDITIRTIPPNQLMPKTSDGIISIPPLEIPETVSKLREALMPKTIETIETLGVSQDSKDKDLDDNEKSNLPPRTVRWLDDVKIPGNATVSSSDSFQSAESLRERSSSEVLEVAPTLPSQVGVSRHTILERSSSEIETSPEDQVRWVGGVVPVLESLSPEFLANIPVVIQGGFFNRQRTVASDKD